ncbi:MAG TPA: single-stranded-DNA-specific exonuclease RecJ, partial [Ferruginibacter sp.]|nr:single-stranded-DNA-specific exonuclease RecJ [Ferruginibacter sp.]
FAAKFEETVSATIPEHLLVPEITVDAVIRFKDINTGFYSIICQMEPFGPENMRPVFVAERVLDTGYSKVVKEEHLRFVVKQDNISFTGIGFNLAGKFPLLSKPFDMAFTLDENEWNGNTTLQLKVIDIRPSQPL